MRKTSKHLIWAAFLVASIAVIGCDGDNASADAGGADDLADPTISIDNVDLFAAIAGMFDVYMSSVSNRMNDVMKVLTIIATLFIPITFLAGLYGMNFKFMPEVQWRWGYPIVLLIMAAAVIGMLFYFRRKKWL